jgi:hypothetical protein
VPLEMADLEFLLQLRELRLLELVAVAGELTPAVLLVRAAQVVVALV